MKLRNAVYEFISLIPYKYYKIKTMLWYKLFFNSIGKNSVIVKPIRINNPHFISIGKNVIINNCSWLYTNKCDIVEPRLIIEEGTQIGNFAHIVAVGDIRISKNVLIADKVYIADNNHEFSRIDIPIMHQGVRWKKNVFIGEGSWIGEGVSIIGASIGKNCIIGSNAVVTSDIGDYSIAVGAPAKVIKKYDINTQEWIKVN